MEQFTTQSDNRPLRILLVGASGLVGEALASFLTAVNHEVWKLVRREPKSAHEIRWDPDKGAIDAGALENFEAIIHLSGESIAKQRWTPEFKAALLKSRVVSTSILVKALAGLNSKPRVLITASATGYYGDRGAELLTESSARGSGFLPELCDRWEIVARQAENAGIRTVQLRLGIVLSPRGGALKKMLLAFRLGAGGVIGCGSQFMSWIAIDDVIGGIYHALVNDKIRGPMNLVSPHPVSNRVFTKTLAAVLHRPSFVPLPATAVRILFGEMGDTLLLGSARVSPGVLATTGYEFLFPTLEAALRHELL